MSVQLDVKEPNRRKRSVDVSLSPALHKGVDLAGSLGNKGVDLAGSLGKKGVNITTKITTTAAGATGKAAGTVMSSMTEIVTGGPFEESIASGLHSNGTVQTLMYSTLEEQMKVEEAMEKLNTALKQNQFTRNCFGILGRSRHVSDYQTPKGPMSFFYNVFSIILVAKGSVFNNILPQLVCAMVLTFLASQMDQDISSRGHQIIAIPLSFLLVFKTQVSYQQYWEARGHLGNIVRASRSVVIEALSFIRNPDLENAEDRQTLKQQTEICRLLKLFYLLVIRHARKSGASVVSRNDPVMVADQELIDVLATDEDRQAFQVANKLRLGASGYNRSQSLIILQKIYEILSEATDHKRLGMVRAHVVYDDMRTLMVSFNGIDKINKMLFPFPYAQMVKLFNFLFCFTLPFALWSELSDYTYGVVVIIVVGFYGLDEIGEYLEDPFGTDPNSLKCDTMGIGLLQDIDVFHAYHHDYDRLLQADSDDTANSNRRLKRSESLVETMTDLNKPWPKASGAAEVLGANSGPANIEASSDGPSDGPSHIAEDEAKDLEL